MIKEIGADTIHISHSHCYEDRNCGARWATDMLCRRTLDAPVVILSAILGFEG